jgi:hypothetical protein
MMRYPKGWIAAWMLIIFVSSMGTLQAADLKDGFMGIPWKTDLSVSPDFVKIDQEGDISNFVKPSVIHTVGDVKIYPVVYSCFANQFFGVYFQNDIILYSRLRNHFNQNYGSATTTRRVNPNRTIHAWNHHDAKIKLKLNRETGKIQLAFYYTPLSVKVDEMRLEAYQERTRRFLDRIDRDRAIEILDMTRPGVRPR